MNKGSYYTERKKYIHDLEKVLKPIQDFNELKYACEYYTDTEYLRLTDILGGAIFIDITAKSLEDIFKEITKVINGKTPDGIITDLTILRHVATLFQKVN